MIHTGKQYAGIDGGGTSTEAMIIDDTGKILGTGRTGPSSYGAVSTAESINAITGAFRMACESAGTAPGDISSLFIGLGGILRPNDKEMMISLLPADIFGEIDLINIENDTRNSLAGGLGGKPGLTLICGTGAVCYGRNNDGTEWKSGGWGQLFDDAGSGYYLGIQGLKAMVRGLDGRCEPSSVGREIMQELGIDSLNEIIHRIYDCGFTRSQIAGLSRIVSRCAEEGDSQALEIMEEGALELIKMVKTVARKISVDSQRLNLVMTGGVISSGTYMRTLFIQKIEKVLPHIEIIDPLLDPTAGSVLLAMESAGYEIDDSIVRRLGGRDDD